jgi:hypothetical protein
VVGRKEEEGREKGAFLSLPARKISQVPVGEVSRRDATFSHVALEYADYRLLSHWARMDSIDAGLTLAHQVVSKVHGRRWVP